MLEVLKFVFSNFWIWLGATIMLAIVVEGFTGIIKISIKNYRKKNK